MEVVEWNKMVPSLPLLPCELSVSVKENPDRKKKKKNPLYVTNKDFRELSDLKSNRPVDYNQRYTVNGVIL